MGKLANSDPSSLTLGHMNRLVYLAAWYCKVFLGFFCGDKLTIHRHRRGKIPL